MKRYALSVYLYISVQFSNRAWYIVHGWSYILSIRSKVFQTTKQGWANMRLHPFLVYIGLTAVVVECIGKTFLDYGTI